MNTSITATDRALPRHRRDEIRQKAAHLFESRGYSETTMTEIADAVGILPGSLYHHFTSKEEIAVEILSDLNRDLARVATETLQQLPDVGSGSEEQIRFVAERVTDVSIRSGAALRLYSYEAPSVATERFRSALALQVPALDKAWRRAFEGFSGRSGGQRDTGLLRFALHQLTLHAAINSPEHTDAACLSRQLCDLLLDGLALSCPDDEALDSSEALAAARSSVSSWTPQPQPTGTGTREDIIAAARIEFARRGFHATTIRDVAEAAGVHMGTLYRRVNSKEEILAEILGNYAESLERGVRSVLTTGTSVVESLDALAYVFVHGKRRFRRESEIVKIGWRGRETEDNPFHEYFRQTQARLRLLEQVLRRGIADQAVRPIGAPADVAPLIRSIIWLPLQDYRRTSAPRAHWFLRESLLRGFLNG